MFSVYAAILSVDSIFLYQLDANVLSAGLIEMLEGRRGNQGLYMGCMKSGVVVSEEYALSFT
jgi:hydroxyproline O-galactosyltransferase HPGT